MSYRPTSEARQKFGQHLGKRFQQKFPRLVAKSNCRRTRLVHSTGGVRCGSAGAYGGPSDNLDCGPAVDGNVLHRQRKAVWADSLPIHRTLFFTDDCAGIADEFSNHSVWLLRLAHIRQHYSTRKQSPMVEHGAHLGKILLTCAELRRQLFPSDAIAERPTGLWSPALAFQADSAYPAKCAATGIVFGLANGRVLGSRRATRSTPRGQSAALHRARIGRSRPMRVTIAPAKPRSIVALGRHQGSRFCSELTPKGHSIMEFDRLDVQADARVHTCRGRCTGGDDGLSKPTSRPTSEAGRLGGG